MTDQQDRPALLPGPMRGLDLARNEIGVGPGMEVRRVASRREPGGKLLDAVAGQRQEALEQIDVRPG
jgi:hypothetical protein